MGTLKFKKKPEKTKMPQTQAIDMRCFKCRADVKREVIQELQDRYKARVDEELDKCRAEMQRQADDTEEWTDMSNSVTFLNALADEFGFGAERMSRVIERSNQLTRMVNDGQLSMRCLVERIRKKGMCVSERYDNLIKMYEGETE